MLAIKQAKYESGSTPRMLATQQECESVRTLDMLALTRVSILPDYPNVYTLDMLAEGKFSESSTIWICLLQA